MTEIRAPGSLAGRSVVVVVAWATMGGAERHALRLVEHLVEIEHARVEILGLTAADGRFRRALEERGLHWHAHHVEWSGSRVDRLRTLAGFARRLRRLRPDVVVPYCTRPNVLCGLMWRATGASLCLWNQRDIAPSTRFSPSLARRAVRAVPLVVANSETAAAFLTREHGVSRERILVARDIVPPAKAVIERAGWRNRLAVAPDAPMATMLAHLHRFKDHATMLRAWRIVTDAVPTATLVLAGRNAGTEETTKALAFDLDLRASVRFPGDVEDVAGLLDATDVAVLSSPAESAPNAIIESMWHGLPIAATDIDALRELLPPEQHAYLAPAGDAEALARVLLELFADSALRQRLGERNEEHVRAIGSESGVARVVSAIAERVGRTIDPNEAHGVAR